MTYRFVLHSGFMVRRDAPYLFQGTNQEISHSDESQNLLLTV